jgi:S-adenosylmethionine:tRNA ribosyltransferase-isomerase
MIAADRPVQRPRDARLLVVGPRGAITHALRARFVDFLRPGDLVIANDAATLPASLHGVHVRSGGDIEVRLAGWSVTKLRLAPPDNAPRSVSESSLPMPDIHAFTAVVFGAGDYHTRTEDRPLPPPLLPGDRLMFGSAAIGSFDRRRAAGHGEDPPVAGYGDGPPVAGYGDGPLEAAIEALLDHPRLVRLRFGGPARAVWAGLARHGRPIQYAHVTTPLAMWDVWTPIAGLPAAFEPPSAGFALDWRSIGVLRERGIEFATITLAAGISSTGDPALDRRLPLDEPYVIPASTAAAISRARAEGRRIVAVGTTVVRGLEHAAALDGVVRPGSGIADQHIGPDSRLRIVDVLLSGTHEPGGSHYQILRAFLDDGALADADAALDAQGYRTHEFGDSVMIERMDRAVPSAAGSRPEERIAPAAA